MTSLTSGGSWTNDQYTGEDVDPTGLTFEVGYSDGTSASVNPQAHTPSVWGSEAGTQTCTFTYTEDGESVSCAVEATVIEEVVVTLDSLSISGSLTNSQYVGHAPDVTGLTVTAHYSDSTLDKTVTASVTPATYTTSGEQDITFSYSDEYGSVTEDYTVTVSDVYVTSLSSGGSINGDVQYAGEAPNITGLTFTKTYNDGTTGSVSTSDIVISPATYEDGNPNNLGTTSLSFSYTENGHTVTNVGPTATIHRRSSGQILNMNQAGYVYCDMPSEVKAVLDQASSVWGPTALLESRTASQGDIAFGVFDAERYQDSSKSVDSTVLGGWLSTYGLGSQGETFEEVGTPNTPGYVPAYGLNFANQSTGSYNLNDCSIAFRTDGTATMSAGDVTVYLVVGPLVSGITDSYNIGNWDPNYSYVVSCICRKS